MRQNTALKLACIAGALLLTPALGCGRVTSSAEAEVVEAGLCNPSDEWHLIDSQIDERAVQSLLWDGTGTVVATNFRDQAENLSSLERFQLDGTLQFRTRTDLQIGLLSRGQSGFFALGHGDGNRRRVALQVYDAAADWAWNVSFLEEQDVWPAAVYELDEGLLVIGTQEAYSGSDTDVVVFGLTRNGERRFTQVYGEDPPVIGQASDERVVGTFKVEQHVVVLVQSWLNGSGGPLKALALNAQGEALWEYNDDFEYARGTYWAIAPTADGGALVVGSPSAGGVSHGSARMLRLSVDGKPLWIKTLKDAVIEEPEIIAATELPGGDFFLTGVGIGPVTQSWRIGPAGDVRAVATHTPAQLGGAPHFARVQAMPAGGVLLVAQTLSAAEPNLSLIRTDIDGQALWQHQVTGEGAAWASDVLVSPEGQVVLAGRFAQEDTGDERHVLQLSDACQLQAAGQ